MGMTQNYRNALASAGAALITHIGLVDDQGKELTGGSPAYARQPVQWKAPIDGMNRPAADLLFNIGPGSVVAGWRGFSASASGTNYGGEDLLVEPFVGQGEYKLLASKTGIAHRAP